MGARKIRGYKVATTAPEDVVEAFRQLAERGDVSDPEDPACDIDFGVCTNGARFAQEVLGRGEVLGYRGEDNPKAAAGRTTEGHDFLLVDGRWIIDWWAAAYEGAPWGVLDVWTQSKTAEKWYGDPDRWVSP